MALLPRAVVHDCTGGRKIATPRRFGAEDRSTGAEHAVSVHASFHAFEMQAAGLRICLLEIYRGVLD